MLCVIDVSLPKVFIEVGLFKAGARIGITPEFDGICGYTKTQKTATSYAQEDGSKEKSKVGESGHQSTLA